jgi:iron complex outermembrane receptor protein
MNASGAGGTRRQSGNGVFSDRFGKIVLALSAVFPAGGAFAADLQQSPAKASAIAAPVVVTATRIEQSSFDLPVSIDSLTQEQIQGQKVGANISEVLGRLPGTVVQNRETYAQEPQLLIRGFGSRSQFGVRGIKLIADGIPASTPDGQGGTGLFDLSSAKSIEVLRGPFSTLYGNHSGGVVQLFTEDGPQVPTLSASVAAGSYGTWKAGTKIGGQSGNLNYIASLSRYETEGYRDWSHAQKDQFNAKFRYAADAKSSWTFVANSLDQQNNEDPLGLTQSDIDTLGRRAANPLATQFKTRRSLDNRQVGATYESAVSETDSVRANAYYGNRSNEQYLAINAATQNNMRAAGGLSTFDRDFWGIGARWTRRASALTLTAGADYEKADEARKGYRSGLTQANDATNANYGTQGALKRDEDNSVYQTGAYMQAEWQLNNAWSLSGGLRYTKLDFQSRDKFICTTTGAACSGSTFLVGSTDGNFAVGDSRRTRLNPDDSGSVSYSAWTPAVGVVWKLNESTNLYANAGRSFEAPTFIELAYKPDGSSGMNFGLQPSKSNHFELGAKSFLGAQTRLNFALFHINTSNEIVIATNETGRATYQNAGDTRRRGLELSLDSSFGGGFAGYLAATYLDAKFKDSFRTCPGTPCSSAQQVVVSGGKRIPGVPDYQVFGELSWRYAPLGFSSAVEGRWTGRVQVNDVNTVSTASYFVANVRAGFEQTSGDWRLNEFVRVDNLFDEKYIGAVYVNDANGRYFAPAPERGYTVGVSASYRF